MKTNQNFNMYNNSVSVCKNFQQSSLHQENTEIKDFILLIHLNTSLVYAQSFPQALFSIITWLRDFGKLLQIL